MSSISSVGRKALSLVATLALSTAVLASTTTSAQAVDGFTATFETGAFTPIGFGGDNASLVTDAPAGFNGSSALKVVRGWETWAGTTIANSADYKLVTPDNLVATLKVKAPASGKKILLKIEDRTDGNVFVQAEAFTTGTSWETLTFTFSGLNANISYNKASVFSDNGSTNTGDIYYYDDVYFPATSTVVVPRTADSTLVTFEDNDTTGFIEVGFEGASAEVAAVPAGGNGGNGLKITRNGGQVYAGVTVLNSAATTTKYTSSSNKIVTMNFYTAVSVPVMLQLNVGYDNAEQTVTAPAGWSVLSFDFGATLSAGAYSNDIEYLKVSIFPHFGTVGSGQVFYVDNMAINGATTPAIPVAKTAQTIGKTVASMKAKKLVSLPAKTNKGLTVRWTSKTKAVCVIAGTSAAPKVKSLKVGTCKLTGTNAGNSTKSAVTVNRTILVKK